VEEDIKPALAHLQENRKAGDVIYVYYRAVRRGNYSTIGYCRLKGPLEVVARRRKPVLFPEKKYESQGIEDPRIVKIDDTWHMTYSVYDRMNVAGAYATSKDLKSFTKHRIITPRFTYREYKHLIECNTGLNDKYLLHYRIFKEHGLGEETTAQRQNVWAAFTAGAASTGTGAFLKPLSRNLVASVNEGGSA